MQNILVVNVNWLGDVIFSSPVFKAIKENYPQARVSCLAVPRVKEILESIPGVDEIIIYDEKKSHRGPLAKLRLIADLRRRKFDAAFLLHGSWTRALMIFLAGIPRRVGYATKNRALFLTQRIDPVTSGSRELHRADVYLEVIRSYAKISDRRCVLQVSPQAEREVKDILQTCGVAEHEPFLIVNTGGNWDLKRWPEKYFRQLIHRLGEETRWKVVVPGGPADISLAESVAQERGLRTIILAGKTDLKQLIALMKRASLVVSADSGPLHIADAVGTPTLGLFGPTRPEITGPRGGGCSLILQKNVGCNRAPCYYLECPDNICMKTITVDEVFAAIQKLV